MKLKGRGVSLHMIDLRGDVTNGIPTLVFAAEQIIAERGLSTADPKLRREMAKPVDMVL